jgi:hypothetical protein
MSDLFWLTEAQMAKLHAVANARGRPVGLYLSAGKTSITSARGHFCRHYRRLEPCWRIVVMTTTGSASIDHERY